MTNKNSSKLATTKSHYPVAIIGGGIVGAGIFRDLSLHQVPTLLIEKWDFTSQTSQSSSKMLHGGIRYLENMDLALIKEALQEKNLWLKLTPHLATERRFYLPVYKDSLRPLWQIRIGLFLYDLLSLFKNTAHGHTDRKETKKNFPELRQKGLSGCGYYYDAVVDDAKLTLECIYDGLKEPNCQALNYVGLEDVKTNPEHQKQKYQLILKDQITGQDKIVTCGQLIFATGPFADKLLKNISYLSWQDKLIPSKGSHLWLKKDALKINDPMVLTPKDGRVVFVIPHQDSILIGTTECAQDVAFNQEPSQEEITYLLDNVNDFFTKANVTNDHIIGMFAGTRPLIKDPSAPADRSKTAREHQVYQPHSHTFVIIGGKYTTFRTMSSELTSLVLRQRKQPYDASLTLAPLRQASRILSPTQNVTEADLDYIKDHELVRTKEDIIRRRIGHPLQSPELGKLIDSLDLP